MGFATSACFATDRTFSTLGNGRRLFAETDKIESDLKRRPTMEYFAGLDISMEETHVCVLDGEGAVVHEARTISTAEAICSLAKAPSCRRVVFETGRMTPMLYTACENATSLSSASRAAKPSRR